jgi:hypothetical protein
VEREREGEGTSIEEKKAEKAARQIEQEEEKKWETESSYKLQKGQGGTWSKVR